MGFWNRYHLSNHGYLEVSMFEFQGFFSNSHNHGSVENGPSRQDDRFFLEISR